MAADNSRGPVGLLGIPPRVFRERSVTSFGSSSQARSTQAGIEAWTVSDPRLLATQAGLDAWTASNPRRLVTHAGLESRIQRPSTIPPAPFPPPPSLGP